MKIPRNLAALVLAALAALAASPATARPRKAPPPPVSALDLKRPPQPEWYGVYLGGKKAGFARSAIQVETREGRRVLVANERLVIKASMGGRPIERAVETEKVYEAAPAGRLLAFSARNEGDGGARTVRGRCDDAGCTAVVESAGPPQELRWPGHRETAEQADPQRLAAARRADVRGPALELLELRVRHMVDHYAGTARRAAGGVETEVALVEEREEGDRATFDFEIAPGGRLVEARMGGVVQRPEAEAEARRLDGRADAMASSRVVLPGPLAGAGVPGSVRYVLRGVPPAYQTADDARQVWRPLPDGAAELTVTAQRPAAADPRRDAPRVRGAPPADLAPWLSADAAVDADNPAVARLAREVVGDTPGVYAAAVKLSHAVHGRLRQTYGTSSDRASDVLRSGQGDCTEHALLLTALARAAGVPARTVNGVVYSRYGDGVPALYWHAWVEVKSGEAWIPLDPIFDQPVADATHVALGRATRPGEVMRTDIIQLLGQIRAERADPIAAR